MQQSVNERFIAYAKQRAKDLREEAKLREVEAGAWDTAAVTLQQFVDQEQRGTLE